MDDQVSISGVAVGFGSGVSGSTAGVAGGSLVGCAVAAGKLMVVAGADGTGAQPAIAISMHNITQEEFRMCFMCLPVLAPCIVSGDGNTTQR